MPIVGQVGWTNDNRQKAMHQLEKPERNITSPFKLGVLVWSDYPTKLVSHIPKRPDFKMLSLTHCYLSRSISFHYFGWELRVRGCCSCMLLTYKVIHCVLDLPGKAKIVWLHRYCKLEKGRVGLYQTNCNSWFDCYGPST